MEIRSKKTSFSQTPTAIGRVRLVLKENSSPLIKLSYGLHTFKMFSRRSFLLDCVLRIISQYTYGGTLRRINAGMQESLRWTHNKYKMDTVIPKIPVKVRCMKEEDIPHVMEMRRQLRVHDVPTFLQTWMKIDPEGMFVALTEDDDRFSVVDKVLAYGIEGTQIESTYLHEFILKYLKPLGFGIQIYKGNL
ncbi:UNVERIFIED_CONTAM: hypothetical protein NCL1_45888 [Trichonephila clavipes]